MMKTFFQLVLTLALMISGQHADGETITVKTKASKDVLFTDNLSVPAQIIPLNQSIISSEISAQIQIISVNIADKVKKGQIIIKLDCQAYNAGVAESKSAIKAAQAEESLAKKQLKRMKYLLARKTIGRDKKDQSESHYQVSKANVEVARSRLKMAIINQKKCVLKSPFNGIVTDKQAQLGSLAAPGSALLTILQTDNLEVVAQIPEKMRGGFDTARQFYFQYRRQKTVLKLRKKLALVDADTQSQQVYLTFKTKPQMEVGSRGRLLWLSGKHKIPAEYLIQRHDEIGIMVVQDEQAKFIKIANAFIGQPAIYDGQTPFTLITEGRYSVSDGDAINIKN